MKCKKANDSPFVKLKRLADAAGKTTEINSLCSFFMSVNAQTEICVSGCSDVTELSDCEIKLSCVCFELVLRGNGLRIEHFSSEDTVITGEISAIEFERGKENVPAI